MRITFIVAGLILIGAIGCDLSPKSGRGFTLPTGDVAAGRATFRRLNCHVCHAVEGIEQVKPLGEDHEPKESQLNVALGGEVSRIQTYGELVTSVINPSHRFAPGYAPEDVQAEGGQSAMINYNDRMTVTELIDLVAFLQSQYTLKPYPTTPYAPHD